MGSIYSIGQCPGYCFEKLETLKQNFEIYDWGTFINSVTTAQSDLMQRQVTLVENDLSRLSLSNFPVP